MLTSDGLPDICFFGGGGNNEGSRRGPDTVEPDDIPGPGVKVRGGRGEDANGVLLGPLSLPDDLPGMLGACARGAGGI